MFSTFLPALIWLFFVVRRRRLWRLFDGLSFASVFIVLIGHFDAVLKCIVEITDRSAAPLPIQLQWVVDIGSMFTLQ
jgi:hypothetical protein